MADWVVCTRKADNMRIHLNLGTVRWLRWDENGEFTLVSWSTGKEDAIRLLEHPNELLKNERDLGREKI